MNLSKPIAIAFLLAVSLLALSTTNYDDSWEVWNTFLDLEVAGRLLEVCAAQHPDFLGPTEWMPIDEFAKGLPKIYARRIPYRDGWARKFLVGTIYGDLTIVSKGENGIADTIDALQEESGQSPRSLPFGDDIVLVVGKEILNGPRTVRSRQNETMADLRLIATAVESFAIDNNLYPLQDDGLRTLDSIRHHLEPIYIRTVPLDDAWESRFLYWSDQMTYVIVSAGADATFDAVWSERPPRDVDLVGETDDPNVDIVFADGRFVQWPSREAPDRGRTP